MPYITGRDSIPSEIFEFNYLNDDYPFNFELTASGLAKCLSEVGIYSIFDKVDNNLLQFILLCIDCSQ